MSEQESESEKARRVIRELTRAQSEGVLSSTPERDYPLRPPVDDDADRIAELAESNARLQIKLHKASAMVARLKCASNARPESPAYYLQNNVDCADIVNAYALGYWEGGAVVHILRAGNKPGETRLQALENALGCLRHAVAAERAR